MAYLSNFGIVFCVYAMLWLALNLAKGVSGFVLLTHALFYGAGAYATVILTRKYGFSLSLFLPLCLTVTIICYAAAVWLGRSSFGRTLKALEEDEKLTMFLGYQTLQYKSFVFAVSALMAGIAGSFLGLYIVFVNHASFQLAAGIFFFALIVAWGFRSAFGKKGSKKWRLKMF